MSLIPRPSSPSPQEPISQPQPSDGIVLDALPYVEALDPHYEQQAISLIEAELANSMNEDEHPFLKLRLMPPSRFIDDNSDGLKNAPLARSVYQSIVERQQNGQPAQLDVVNWNHPLIDDPQSIQDLQTSVNSSKIMMEHHRIHLANLDLHSTLCTPHQYQAYHSLLENQYVIPQSKLLEEQRIKVDGINASRMEEQEGSMRKMMTLRQKWEGLMEKNGRLEAAIERLADEVKGLEREVGAVAGGDDEMMEGGAASKEH
jgi:hypothetical protein